MNYKGIIRTVKTLKEKNKRGKIEHSFGETEFKDNSFVVRVALDRNKMADEFCGTVLHELLHVWFKIISVVGVRVRSDDEHDVIEAIEGVVMYFVHLHLKRRKV